MYFFEIKQIYHHEDNTMSALIWFNDSEWNSDYTNLFPVTYDYEKESFYTYIPSGRGKSQRYYFNPAEYPQNWPVRGTEKRQVTA